MRVTDHMHYQPAAERPDLLSDSVRRHLESWKSNIPPEQLQVAEIDPEVADTAAMCERYGFSLDDSVNCVVIAGKRGDEIRMTACVVLATTRVHVNGVVRKRLDVRKASFAAMNDAIALTGMEFGGITPFGLPEGWPVLVDSRVVEHENCIYGSGVRRSKLFAPGQAMLDLAHVEIVDGLAR